MKPPYEITLAILKLIASISIKLGEVNANFMDKPSLQLRKENKIKTIHASLKIEGNTLSEEQITAILDDKRVIGPKKDINEVVNAINVYRTLQSCNPHNQKSFLKAHATLMKGLISNPGNYRKEGVGIVTGSKVEHVAPPHGNVPFLMKDLFEYLKSPEEIALIKSCVFHYELEFIHPFLDGNGRMGRLWQTIILMDEHPVFEYLPFETLIGKDQKKYYKALSESDKIGKSTSFIEYMLNIINISLIDLLNFNSQNLSVEDRLEYFLGQGKTVFSRKDYMNVFKDISTATASRDLKKGKELGFFIQKGEKNKTKYEMC